jgi:hypothetical protein
VNNNTATANGLLVYPLGTETINSLAASALSCAAQHHHHPVLRSPQGKLGTPNNIAGDALL